MAKLNHHATLVQKTREMLVASFPNCFMPKGADKLPLKIGINKDIIQAIPEIGFKNLTEALIDYTGGPSYLAAMRSGASRYDLDGKPCGIVREVDAEHAAERMKGVARWRAKHPLVEDEPEAQP